MPRKIEETDPVDVHVGQRLRAERLRCKLTQSEMGRAIGVTFQQVQKYENGKNRVSASMLVRAAHVLDVSIVDLFPAETASATTTAPDLSAIKGGAELARSYAAMTGADRALLVQLAASLAGHARTG
jgi:transcriptional regulator with XRE-family HTH domain